MITMLLLGSLLCNSILTIYAAEIEQFQVQQEQTGETEQSAEMQKEGGTRPAVEIAAPSAILMEASTGQIIYERNANERRSPASITKIMTLILIFDALEAGKIKLQDEAVTSAYAKSMGGSQVFPGRRRTADGRNTHEMHCRGKWQ